MNTDRPCLCANKSNTPLTRGTCQNLEFTANNLTFTAFKYELLLYVKTKNVTFTLVLEDQNKCK